MSRLLVLGVATLLTDVVSTIERARAGLLALKRAFEPGSCGRFMFLGWGKFFQLPVVEGISDGIPSVTGDISPLFSTIAYRGNRDLAAATKP